MSGQTVFALATIKPEGDPSPSVRFKSKMPLTLRSELLGELTSMLKSSDQVAIGGLVQWHLLRTRHMIELSTENGPFHVDAECEAWAWKCNALWMTTDGIFDPAGRSIFAMKVASDPSNSVKILHPDAQLPFPLEARKRQAQIGVTLANRSVDAPNGLFPVFSADEASWQPAVNVARRSLALFATAVRAESILSGNPLSSQRIQAKCEQAFANLSPVEQQLMADPAKPELAACLAWRYESLMTLQWALGMQFELPFPDERCDLTAVTRLMIDLPDAEIVSQAKLRSHDELLDAAELHFQAWHALAMADANHRAGVSSSLDPNALDSGVVAERLAALAWLIGFSAPVLRRAIMPPAEGWDLTSQWIEEGMPLSQTLDE